MPLFINSDFLKSELTLKSELNFSNNFLTCGPNCPLYEPLIPHVIKQMNKISPYIFIQVHFL